MIGHIFEDENADAKVKFLNFDLENGDRHI